MFVNLTVALSMREQLNRIETLAASGEVKKADVLVARLLRSELLDENRGKVLRCRARVRLLSARPDDAIEDLRLADQLDPENADQAVALELLGESYFARFELASVGFSDRGDAAEAHRLFSVITSNYPDYNNLGWIYYQLGRISLSGSNVAQAEAYFQQALLNPSQFSYLTAYCFERLGFISYYERRDLERSLNFLNRAIDTYPPSQTQNWIVQVRLLRSRVLKGMQQHSEAIKSATDARDQALALRPENKQLVAEALFALGELLTETEGNEREIISYLSQFVQLTKKPQGVDVTWSRVYEMLGNAHFSAGHYEDAISAFRTALQYNPDHPWGLSLYYRIGCSYYHQREYDNVITTVDRILQSALKDNHSIEDYRIYDLLGNAFFAQHQYTSAVEAYENALRLLPPNADNNSDKIKSYHDLALKLM